MLFTLKTQRIEQGHDIEDAEGVEGLDLAELLAARKRPLLVQDRAEFVQEPSLESSCDLLELQDGRSINPVRGKSARTPTQTHAEPG